MLDIFLNIIGKYTLQEDYTHCYGHSLSLSVGDTVKGVKFLQSIMDTTHEISKLIQYSPKRRALLETKKGDLQ